MFSKSLKHGLLLTAAMVGLMGTAQAAGKPASSPVSAMPAAAFFVEVCAEAGSCEKHLLSTATMTLVSSNADKGESVGLQVKASAPNRDEARVEYKLVQTSGTNAEEITQRLRSDEPSQAHGPDWATVARGEFRGGDGATQVLNSRWLSVTFSRAEL